MKRVLASLGAVLLAAGAWTPLLGSASQGNVNLFAAADFARILPTGTIEGVALLVLAAATVLAAVLKRRKALWAAAGASSVLVALSFVNVLLGRAHIQIEVPGKAAEAASLRWGWLVLCAGAIMVLIAAALRRAETHDPDDDEDKGPDGVGGATQKMVRYQMGEGIIPRATD